MKITVLALTSTALNVAVSLAASGSPALRGQSDPLEDMFWATKGQVEAGHTVINVHRHLQDVDYEFDPIEELRKGGSGGGVITNGEESDKILKNNKCSEDLDLKNVATGKLTTYPIFVTKEATPDDDDDVAHTFDPIPIAQFGPFTILLLLPGRASCSGQHLGVLP